MRYKPKSSAALHIALGGLPAQMRVEVDPGIAVSAKTVGELRKMTASSRSAKQPSRHVQLLNRRVQV